MARIVGMRCPHCNERATIYTSKEITPTLREMYLQCSNLVCGHTWIAAMEAVRTISPPSQLFENPNLKLPMSEAAELKKINQIINETDSSQTDLFD